MAFAWQKERILIPFKTITPIFIKNTGYMVKIGDIYGSFKIIAIPFKTIA